jgi:hypothetical protein
MSRPPHPPRLYTETKKIIKAYHQKDMFKSSSLGKFKDMNTDKESNKGSDNRRWARLKQEL